MTMTKTMDISTYKKKYAYEIEDGYNFKMSDYYFPTIKFYELYQYDNKYSKYSPKFEIRYQGNIENGNRKPAYGGSIEHIDLGYVGDLNTILSAASTQQKKLELYGGDQCKNMVSALRAAGYREIVAGNDIIYNVK
jgi:hypothetical protein